MARSFNLPKGHVTKVTLMKMVPAGLVTKGHLQETFDETCEKFGYNKLNVIKRTLGYVSYSYPVAFQNKWKKVVEGWKKEKETLVLDRMIWLDFESLRRKLKNPTKPNNMIPEYDLKQAMTVLRKNRPGLFKIGWSHDVLYHGTGRMIGFTHKDAVVPLSRILKVSLPAPTSKSTPITRGVGKHIEPLTDQIYENYHGCPPDEWS